MKVIFTPKTGINFRYIYLANYRTVVIVC